MQLKLERISLFDHGGSPTLWLDPQSQELERLQSALQAAFPACTDLSSDPERGITRFTPHLSLGQAPKGQARALAARLQHDWTSLSFTVDSVQMISRQGFRDPFVVRYSIPVGSAAEGMSRSSMEVPYVATVPVPRASSRQGAPFSLAQRFGVGAQPGGVWNFAYGANINPHKLSVVRGIRPLESLPASLPGWRLAFNHRGAMGNLVKLQSGEAAPSGLPAVHGVLHQFSYRDFATLTDMEHEYFPTEVSTQPYDGRGPVAAVAFISPAERLIQEGAPPPDRYVKLIVEGAASWQLDASYVAWLRSLPMVVSSSRGTRYWTGADGRPLHALPKLRNGSNNQQPHTSHRSGGYKGGQCRPNASTANRTG